MFLTAHLIVHQHQKFCKKKQAASLAQCQNKQLEVRFIDVQVQEGSDDCRVFAIAFATALGDIVDPHSLSLDQKKMREHLASCFEKGEMLPFPLSATPRRVKKVQKVTVYYALGPPRHLPWKFGPVQSL